MDHSLQTYLKKLSTEQLENFLKQYYAGEFSENFSDTVPYVAYILDKRKTNADKKPE